MFDTQMPPKPASKAIVIGAGVGGLATGLRLQAAGYQVTLVERHGWIGGKMRAVPSAAGPVDAGPTVLTMRSVFDDLFQVSGSQLSDHVTLIREPCLARHFWPDGGTLDLSDDQVASADAVGRFSGVQSKLEFERFCAEAKALYHAFDRPMMRAADPSLPALARAALAEPKLLGTLSPMATLAGRLRRWFSDPRLAQLFGRYATYVGGSPYRSPAILSLIWHAEASGVWRVAGGMHRLAEALGNRLLALGGTILLHTEVRQIEIADSACKGVILENGRRLEAPLVVFNGDPRALAIRALGAEAAAVAPQTARLPRSLSARVWSFAAEVQRPAPPLIHHNVFFAASPQSEFDDLSAGRMPSDPTIYVCAEDRGHGEGLGEGLGESRGKALGEGRGQDTPTAAERFEIILNAAPLADQHQDEPEEVERCRQVTFQTLGRFGLSFGPEPEDAALTTPAKFDAMFPGSAGSLYGQTPHGMTASLQRPRARTRVQGLYLVGGGTHPGAGVPMAALSGQHAAAAILKDHAST